MLNIINYFKAMHMKTTSITSCLSECLSSESLQITNVGKDVKKKKKKQSKHTAGGTVNWYSHVENSTAVPHK